MRKFLLLLALSLNSENFESTTEVSSDPMTSDYVSSQISGSDKRILKSIGNSTVALVVRHNGNYPYCGGVWVSSDKILTASHCIDSGVSFEQKKKFELGDKVHYLSFSERRESYRHDAEVVDIDSAHDLALIRALGEIASHTSITSLTDAADGEGLHIVGHPEGSFWQYSRGQATAYRSVVSDHVDGPYLEINAHVVRGFSGGGAFDSNGNLVGISSFIYTHIPDTAFFIPREHIRSMLERNNIL